MGEHYYLLNMIITLTIDKCDKIININKIHCISIIILLRFESMDFLSIHLRLFIAAIFFAMTSNQSVGLDKAETKTFLAVCPLSFAFSTPYSNTLFTRLPYGHLLFICSSNVPLPGMSLENETKHTGHAFPPMSNLFPAVFAGHSVLL